MKQFKVGDKVKVVQGGWGIHPAFVGRTVTIARVTLSGMYSVKENLNCPETGVSQLGNQIHASWESFELVVPEKTTTDKIREVNQRIHQEAIAHELCVSALKAERDALIETLMEELQ